MSSTSYRERTRRIGDSLASAGSRLVLCGRPPLGPGAPVTVIEYDNEGGAYVLGAHVLAQGHRRVLFPGGKPDHTTAQGRERGYLAAHRARGLEADPELLLHGDFTRDSGHRLMREALRRGLEFTAVVAGTDMVAAGALTALHEAGRDLPGDVSPAGYDDIPFARDLYPALITVHVPYEELGRLAVRTALGHTADSADEHLLLGTHVVVRGSVARPADRADAADSADR
ncbi:LacI family DNA-binding transcriptional regulator [Streptomyces sp. NPDC054834]